VGGTGYDLLIETAVGGIERARRATQLTRKFRRAKFFQLKTVGAHRCPPCSTRGARGVTFNYCGVLTHGPVRYIRPGARKIPTAAARANLLCASGMTNQAASRARNPLGPRKLGGKRALRVFLRRAPRFGLEGRAGARGISLRRLIAIRFSLNIPSLADEMPELSGFEAAWEPGINHARCGCCSIRG